MKSFLLPFRRFQRWMFSIFFSSESSEDVSLFFTPIVRISWLRWLGEICRFTFKRNESNDKRWAWSRWRRMRRWGWRKKVLDVSELNWNNNMLIFYSEKCVAAAVTHFLQSFSSLLLTRFSRLFELSTSVSTFSQFCNLLSLLWSCICFPFSSLFIFTSQLVSVSRSVVGTNVYWISKNVYLKLQSSICHKWRGG